ncbi:MAG: prephenate dehydratase domain-containing protein [Chitinophagales bacterium]|nr:chorismate mutase [Chitinophagales bacterium]MDW8394017.1 prephenate dehydratase domain-containing protein [Chitinophagales bacterium]
MQAKRIAIQGIASSFHDVAARKFFGNEVHLVPCATFRQSCEKVQSGEADYCVMAIENSIAGSILTNYHIIHEARLRIVGEVYMQIELHLLALTGATLEQIREIHSHPMALRQCEDFLLSLNGVRLVALSDTAECARSVVEQQLLHVAVVAGPQTARHFGLSILHHHIETHRRNYTRFLILGEEQHAIAQANKASISFQLDHSPRSLKRVVDAFSAHDVAISKIQSVPIIGRPDQYTFLVDLEWQDAAAFQAALALAMPQTFSFSLLGTYKKGTMTNAYL